MTSKKSEVMTAIADKLGELVAEGKIALVNYQRPKMVFSDFEEWEIPAIQIIDQGELSTHEHGRARKDWNLYIEIVLKGSEAGEVDQQALFDLQYEVERKLFANPQLAVKGMIGLVYNGSATDLHMVLPYFYCRLDITASYYQPLVSDC